MIAFESCPNELLGPLRQVLASLPEIAEVQRPLTVTFKVGRRNVAEVVTVRSDDKVVTVMTARADDSEVDLLVRSGHPFFKPRSGNARGRIGVVLDAQTNWTEVSEVVTDSYLLVAPKRLSAALLDASEMPEG